MTIESGNYKTKRVIMSARILNYAYEHTKRTCTKYVPSNSVSNIFFNAKSLLRSVL